jgi:hypothetical protein
MIDRTYKKLKYFRTYINGSKKNEDYAFLKTQYDENGCEKDENNIDWLEFRKLLISSYEDIIHVNFSRKIITEYLSYLFLSISPILLFQNQLLLSLIPLLIFIILFITHKYYKHKTNIDILNYNLGVVLINNSIKEIIGFDFPNLE